MVSNRGGTFSISTWKELPLEVRTLIAVLYESYMEEQLFKRPEVPILVAKKPTKSSKKKTAFRRSSFFLMRFYMPHFILNTWCLSIPRDIFASSNIDSSSSWQSDSRGRSFILLLIHPYVRMATKAAEPITIPGRPAQIVNTQKENPPAVE